MGLFPDLIGCLCYRFQALDIFQRQWILGVAFRAGPITRIELFTKFSVHEILLLASSRASFLRTLHKVHIRCNLLPVVGCQIILLNRQIRVLNLECLKDYGLPASSAKEHFAAGLQLAERWQIMMS